MNYTWDNIILDNFIKASDGEIKHVAINGEVNEETTSVWFAIQDKYIETLETETVEIKRYKLLCLKYANALRDWLINPIDGSKKQMQVNRIYIQKAKLASEIFKGEKVDWESVIAKATIAVRFRIDSSQMKAKEFFNIIKNL